MDFSRARRKAAWPSICDGDSTRYPGSVYCWICESERAFLRQFGWYRKSLFFSGSCPMMFHGTGAFLFLLTHIFFI